MNYPDLVRYLQTVLNLTVNSGQVIPLGGEIQRELSLTVLTVCADDPSLLSNTEILRWRMSAVRGSRPELWLIDCVTASWVASAVYSCSRATVLYVKHFTGELESNSRPAPFAPYPCYKIWGYNVFLFIKNYLSICLLLFIHLFVYFSNVFVYLFYLVVYLIICSGKIFICFFICLLNICIYSFLSVYFIFSYLSVLYILSV